MKAKLSISVFAYIILCMQISAQSVSPEQAQRAAAVFFSNMRNEKSTRDTTYATFNVRTIGKASQPAMFAISHNNDWVLVSGDERVPPILAYSDENAGTFPEEDDMPPAMKYILDWYESQIDYLRDSASENQRHSQWVQINNAVSLSPREISVSPLLYRNGIENQWGQQGNNGIWSPSWCYNKFCPARHDLLQDCLHTLAGCVAVATSQVMWYWQWPIASVVRDDNGNQLVREYKWELMPPTLDESNTLAEADMIANLLHDVGVSVGMDYGCPGDSTGSGASPDSIPVALSRYTYRSSTLERRADFDAVNWISMLKSNLYLGRPIIYGGSNSEGGHSFVLDGFNSYDEFHVNFGWRGTDNGYFSLNSLGPGLDVFNNQTAIWDIHPVYPSCSNVEIQPSTAWLTNFVIINGGGITISNRTIASTQNGMILSGDYVRLTSGVKVELGSHINIAIRDIDCENSSPNNAPLRHSTLTRKDDEANKSIDMHNPFVIMPNPVKNVLSVTSSEGLTHIYVYNLNGQCMLQTNQTDIDVSSLPQGMYILRAITSTCDLRQAKFIKE